MKNKKLLILAAAAAVLLIIILLPGYTKLQDLIAENKRLEKRIEDLGTSVKELKIEKNKLENDILYIEKVAREQLGVVREDEVVIRERP